MPLLTTRAGASAFGLGWGSFAAEAGQELLGTLDITSASATTDYEFLFDGSQYKSLIISGLVERRTTNGPINIMLKTVNNLSYQGQGIGISRRYPDDNFYGYDTYTSIYATGPSTVERTGFTMHIGSIDQPGKTKPFFLSVMPTYDSNVSGNVIASGHYNFDSSHIKSVRFNSSAGFEVSRAKIYGVKSV